MAEHTLVEREQLAAAVRALVPVTGSEQAHAVYVLVASVETLIEAHLNAPLPEPEPEPTAAQAGDPLYESARAYFEVAGLLEQSGYPRQLPVLEHVRSLLDTNDLTRRESEHQAERYTHLREQLVELLDRFGFKDYSIQRAFERALIESRQHREAASHGQQLREHYRDALVALLEVIRADGTVWLHGARMPTAIHAARNALDNPPEWDGRLR
jgi:hypothetical protein